MSHVKLRSGWPVIQSLNWSWSSRDFFLIRNVKAVIAVRNKNINDILFFTQTKT